jgi:predicted phosphodiesterase
VKLAILADVHANYPALQAVSQHIVDWRPDAVVVAGDIVNRGPRPVECLETLIELQYKHNWRLLRGNHEDYVIAQSLADAPKFGPEAEIHQASAWTASRLGASVSIIASLPERIDLQVQPDCQICIVHASMKGNRVGIYPETQDDELAELISSNGRKLPSLFGVGHTHRPLIRINKNTTVVNAGSAGLPFDGNYQPSYVQATWQVDHWSVKIQRLDYDSQQAEKDFSLTGYLQQAGPLVKLVLRELKEARSHLFTWADRYQDMVLTGNISMTESVDRCLNNKR